MPTVASFLRCSAPGIAVAVLKRPEVGDGMVVRAHETWGVATDAAFVLPRWDIAWDATFRAGEVKTFRINSEGTIDETDLLEGLEAEPA
jgi:hypothetical protein